MKFTDLKDQTIVELAAKGRDIRQQLFKLRLHQATSQLEKVSELRNLRRSVARIETRISQLRKQAA